MAREGGRDERPHASVDDTHRGFTPARIIALVVIVVIALGLGYLGFGGEESVAVPAGAHAGQLKLKPCTYSTEKGSLKADCGTLVVAENRRNPRSRLIALPVTRVRAQSGRRGTPIFRLEGGPGSTNMEFPKASRFTGNRDLVLVGYRGVDGSSKLDCPEVDSARGKSADLLSEASIRASETAFRSCAARLRSDGVDLAGYSLPQRVDDLEDARKALGYHRVDLLSESAGTRTALIYTWRYPSSIERSVMIGVNPPGHYLWVPKQSDDQLRHFAALCAKDEACAERSDDPVASMRRTAADVPDRWLFLPIHPGNARIAAFFGLFDASADAAPISAPMTLHAWRAAAGGDTSGLWFESFAAGLLFPRLLVWGDAASVVRIDNAPAAQHFGSTSRADSALGDAGTYYLWAGGRLTHAWPGETDAATYTRVPTSDIETLMIGGTVDGTTPAVNATREVLPHLSKGHQVVLAEFGHTTDFWGTQAAAGTHLINVFLDSGKVDDSRYHEQAIDFTPDVTQTALGKGLAGTMIGFAILTVLSLLGMARRVRRRGHFGPRTGAALRSVYPLVLGLGGWFLGTLIVLTAAPTVSVNNTLLAVLSIGTPIGLGLYWAWVHRDRSDATNKAGFAAALGGGLIGAWLGYVAGSDLLALVTSIAGAAAAGNLALIVRDIASSNG